MPLNFGVLVVVEERDLAERLAVRLSTLGYHPIVLEHPRQALEAASLHDCCAAVLSERLPEIEGGQLAAMLRLRISDLAVLLLSSRQRDDGLLDELPGDECLEGGGDSRAAVTHWLYGATLGEIESCLESVVEHRPSVRVDSPSPTKPSSQSSPANSPGTYGIYVG